MQSYSECVLWAKHYGPFDFSTVYLSEPLKDTVDNAASLNVSVLWKVELDKLPKATGVIVVHGLGIPKGFHDGTVDRGKSN